MGKGEKIIEALQKKAHTLEELVTLSGASPNTVTITLNYHLKNKGYIVEKKTVDGMNKYKITGQGEASPKKAKKVKAVKEEACTGECACETKEEPTPGVKQGKKAITKSIWDESK